MSLISFPEELIERILSLALEQFERPSWLPSTSKSRLAPLCLSRQLNRIATPLLYNIIHLPTQNHARLLLRTLSSNPELATHIHCLSIAGVWEDAAHIMRLSATSLLELDITITLANGDVDHHLCHKIDNAYADALSTMYNIRHFTLRKPNNVYLSLPRPRAIINAVALAIDHWPHLHTAHIAFKLSDDTPTSPVLSPIHSMPFASTTTTSTSPILTKRNSISGAPTAGPISLLASALASAPSLHTFTTHLPSVWNLAILTISSNSHLKSITLIDGRSNSLPTPCSSHTRFVRYMDHSAPTNAIIGTGLFLKEAKRYPRLSELIRAGTPVMRTRAHTLSASPGLSEDGSNAPVATATARSNRTCSMVFASSARVSSGPNMVPTSTTSSSLGAYHEVRASQRDSDITAPAPGTDATPIHVSHHRGGGGGGGPLSRLRIDTTVGSSSSSSPSNSNSTGAARYARLNVGNAPASAGTGSRSAVVGVNPSWLGAPTGTAAAGAACGKGWNAARRG